MNTYFIKRFIARTAVVLSAAALFCGCSDDDETSTLHFDKPEVVIGPESSTASFILRSDTSLKLHSDADWFTLNLTKGAKSASVIITYSENTSMTEKRTAVITATTLSGDASDSFILSQMPVESYIRLETEALPISATAAGTKHPAWAMMVHTTKSPLKRPSIRASTSRSATGTRKAGHGSKT